MNHWRETVKGFFLSVLSVSFFFFCHIGLQFSYLFITVDPDTVHLTLTPTLHTLAITYCTHTYTHIHTLYIHKKKASHKGHLNLIRSHWHLPFTAALRLFFYTYIWCFYFFPVLTNQVWEGRWRVIPHDVLPDWLKDNDFLLHGHRPPMPSFRACFKSIFRIHTETGNIWTHLLGSAHAHWCFYYPNVTAQINLQVVTSQTSLHNNVKNAHTTLQQGRGLQEYF